MEFIYHKRPSPTRRVRTWQTVMNSPATRFEDNEAIRHQKQLNGNDWGEEEGHRSSAERQHGNHRELQEECRFHG